MDPDELSNIADQISAILQESDSATVSVFNVPVTQRAAVNFDEQLSVYQKYMFDPADTQKAIYNVKSTVHPSYQIHPYIYDFT